MLNLKHKLKFFAFAFLAILLINCKGKESEEKAETPIAEASFEEIDSVKTDEMVIDDIVATGSEDFDQMLNDYESYVNEYVSFYKKAKNGDQSALAEYPTLMEKATKLQESMQEAQNNNQLSTSQITRMSKIQMKMLEAMK